MSGLLERVLAAGVDGPGLGSGCFAAFRAALSAFLAAFSSFFCSFLASFDVLSSSGSTRLFLKLARWRKESSADALRRAKGLGRAGESSEK